MMTSARIPTATFTLNLSYKPFTHIILYSNRYRCVIHYVRATLSYVTSVTNVYFQPCNVVILTRSWQLIFCWSPHIHFLLVFVTLSDLRRGLFSYNEHSLSTTSTLKKTSGSTLLLLGAKVSHVQRSIHLGFQLTRPSCLDAISSLKMWPQCQKISFRYSAKKSLHFKTARERKRNAKFGS